MVIGLVKKDAFSLSRDHTSLRCQRIMWLHRQVPLTISLQSTMFCVVKDLAEGERLSFQFFAWLHVITWSEGHYGWVSLFINDLSAKFGGHCPCRRGKILFLICHVSWCDHVVRGSCDIMGEFLSLSLHPANFGGHRRCVREKNFVFCLSRDLTKLRGQRVMRHYGWVSFVISDYHSKFGDHRPFWRGNIKVSIWHVNSRDHMVRRSGDIMGEFSSS